MSGSSAMSMFRRKYLYAIPEQSGNDVVEGRLKRRGLQHRLERDQQRNTERQNHNRREGGGRDGEGGDDLIFRRSGFGPDDVPGIYGTGDLHVDEIPRDECEIPAPGSQHRGVDKILGDAAHDPYQTDCEKTAAEGGHVRERTEIVPDQERRRRQENQCDDTDNATVEMGPVIILYCSKSSRFFSSDM
ncbi:MAG: hypothetical protein K6C12_02870 [Oscillospiraceae bacterium]|nr:hypothetical protein [Oscillospiraceae bacterium]